MIVSKLLDFPNLKYLSSYQFLLSSFAKQAKITQFQKLLLQHKIESLGKKQPCEYFSIYALFLIFKMFHFKSCTFFSWEKTIWNITHDRKGTSKFPRMGHVFPSSKKNCSLNLGHTEVQPRQIFDRSFG